MERFTLTGKRKFEVKSGSLIVGNPSDMTFSDEILECLDDIKDDASNGSVVMLPNGAIYYRTREMDFNVYQRRDLITIVDSDRDSRDGNGFLFRVPIDTGLLLIGDAGTFGGSSSIPAVPNGSYACRYIPERHRVEIRPEK
ncbi:hypothetical protein CMO83_05105 [Candidatus Woesearchaeota archaeon]|jgi:hypothetical protein|nr:hypothetical protein [Candidatus Woesearchaeota archaeon]|tara:strand:+ start:31143 stop:31565 length:423 start_codon:yes stop_codon:yes gene_type:complete